CYFFFFQAEDGIRDDLVTGVQTCALPISRFRCLITLTDERTTDPKTGEAKAVEFKYNGGIVEFIKHLNRGKQVLHDKPIYMEARSEERRVGKEWRVRSGM